MAEEMGKSSAALSALKIEDSERGGSRGRRRAWKWLLLAAGAAAVLAVVVLAMAGRRARVTLASAKSADSIEARTVLNASGYVTPRRRATVAAKITGRVLQVLVDEGMSVKKGQVLARLDARDAEAAYVSASAQRDVSRAAVPGLQARLKEAKLELRRNRELLKSGFVDQQSYDQAEANAASLQSQLMVAQHQVDAASAQMVVARREIDNCVVRAPFDGVVVSKDAQPGEMVSPISAGGGFTRTGISTIVDMSSLEIEVDVNESYIAKVKTGQSVQAVLDAYPDWRIPCRVRTVIPTADRQKATVKVRISFEKLDPRILPDMGVKVAFLSEPEPGGRVSPRVLIPQSCVRKWNGRDVIFVVKDGRAHRREVVLGETRGADVEVLKGLASGDRAVASGPERLEDGQKVSVEGG
ncbi:MAG: efflux RND transporter periplasmic adaptor subunit [Acidobacteriota bacterium]|jgi:RND family efflux transporter MFP subunit